MVQGPPIIPGEVYLLCVLYCISCIVCNTCPRPAIWTGWPGNTVPGLIGG